MEQILTKSNNGVDAVLSANDGMAGGIIAALQAQQLAGKVPVTGLDGTLNSLQLILQGKQSMTVWRSLKEQAGKAAAITAALLKGEKPAADLFNGATMNNDHGDVPWAKVSPVVITLDNMHLEDRGRRGHQGGSLQGNADGRPLQVDDYCLRRIAAMRVGAAPTAAPIPVLELKGISKHFGAVEALSEVDFEVYPAEVVALAGDNGAGKSTLVKVIAGTHAPDAGVIRFDGAEVKIHSPRHATAAWHRDRVPGPRSLRQSRCRRQHVLGPRDRRSAGGVEPARRTRNGTPRARRSAPAQCHDHSQRPFSGRHAFGRPATVGGDFARRHVELEDRPAR